MHFDYPFGTSGLHIAYQASPDPQEVTVQLKLSEADENADLYFLEDWVELINFGAAGGLHFAPELGEAELITEIDDIDPPEGPDFVFQFRCAGVSPKFLRNMVEDVTVISAMNPVALSITGTKRPIAGSPLALTTDQLKAWLNDPDAYIERWGQLPFRVTTASSPRGLNLRLLFASKLKAKTFKAFEFMWKYWRGMIIPYPHTSEPRSGEFGAVAMGRGVREIQIGVDPFSLRSVSLNPLLNMLARFHFEEAPIEEVEIGHA